MDSCSFGKAAECKIYFIDSSNTDYVEITLRDATFSNYKFKAHGEHPSESFDITYTRIDVRHTPRNEKGMPEGSPTSSGFDLLKLKR
jgi:type VI protein secretion system component Hcp